MKKLLAFLFVAALLAAVFVLFSVSRSSAMPPENSYGPNPVLPTPHPPLIPVLNAPNAVGWAEGQQPVAAEGMKVSAFATGLDHPRWIYVLPNGDVLVAETNAPERPEDSKGIKGFFFKFFQKKAGGGVPSANRITLFRD